jgi:hypothetical protein
VGRTEGGLILYEVSKCHVVTRNLADIVSPGIMHLLKT